MNRFRNKKKARDDASIGEQQSIYPESSGPFRMFSKKKSQDDEHKTELDLAAALPSRDDFRTSLLMTGLSARFSMLREQDDPNSKLGKASDDSVLFPKRQSRLAEFGGLGGGLQDIAEVESLKLPSLGRYDSYQSDDAASTTGSIMSRSKATEGNNLFGGRQKIYKLAAGSRAGMSGRALYDDDVAQSAFQRWRQEEKEKMALREDGDNDNLAAEPAINYSRRSETGSTMSSVPSVARNSTAATSIASQTSSKDAQFTSNFPGLERSVTRTRRLYEQGLSQDLQDHQSAALSRMDTISKQRPFTSRAPDSVPSPTASTFGDRATERRTVLSKASAPNLRSFSPSTVGSSPVDSTSKFSRQDRKPSFGVSPPLSPPVSDSGEHPVLAMQPNDRGKATAMGVFNRPALQYDESRFAQRQRQLQQGRDAFTFRPTTESAPSSVGGRSRSSSAHRAPAERFGPKESPSELPDLMEDNGGGPLFDDSDDISDSHLMQPATAPRLKIERPDDQDHPAFRKSALPSPLSINSPKDAGEQVSLEPKGHLGLPGDSPTLGPQSGLSGMVRQHLRHDSAASSVCGSLNHEGGPSKTETHGKPSPPDGNGASNADEIKSDEHDEFAQHLADGARRVRERLITYVESDQDVSAPPTPPQSEQNKEFGGMSRSNGLGILGPKSSLGSLFDKEKERGRGKAAKASGSRPTTAGTSSPPYKASSSRSGSQHREVAATRDGEGVAPQSEENLHGGLKAFRQARRELQKLKELEVQQRHQQNRSHNQEHPPNSRGMAYDNVPPPALFNRVPREEQGYGSRSRGGSRAPSERNRSGSETSNGGRAYSRGPRLRNGSVTYDERHGRAGINGPVSQDAKRQGTESPIMSPCKGTGPPHVGMSPVHNVGPFESHSRYHAPGMQTPPLQDLPRHGRRRNGSLLVAAASTPNLHGSAPAPPLPPINPRRKNGFARGGEDLYGGFGMSDGYVGDNDAAADSHCYSDNAHARGQLRQSPPRMSPPRVRRPPLPQSSVSSASLPGGMI
ncbi:uncharacterized protein UV8b_08005 [Ustilaginoidea virens]|uniref:Uncharacterized protein n=1 Tax=Ustilaginoidea virens TaxID=1159556 RepID=A0A8E5HY30_USTVR|nr:uncharacterized protein UV8b_08005 [Ustilaginoidea virens]QUC23764.1 hypothetical protein UV8b_08005 [Ustilaginoidea virens]